VRRIADEDARDMLDRGAEIAFATHADEVDAQGLVHAPTGPGLGAQIDFELIARKQVAVLA
jgi:L-alanine-DL-glutamate epimerase-like enolase superfamily enzyme